MAHVRIDILNWGHITAASAVLTSSIQTTLQGALWELEQVLEVVI